jgi:hypothetical protein
MVPRLLTAIRTLFFTLFDSCLISLNRGALLLKPSIHFLIPRIFLVFLIVSPLQESHIRSTSLVSSSVSPATDTRQTDLCALHQSEQTLTLKCLFVLALRPHPTLQHSLHLTSVGASLKPQSHSFTQSLSLRLFIVRHHCRPCSTHSPALTFSHCPLLLVPIPASLSSRLRSLDLRAPPSSNLLSPCILNRNPSLLLSLLTPLLSLSLFLSLSLHTSSIARPTKLNSTRLDLTVRFGLRRNTCCTCSRPVRVNGSLIERDHLFTFRFAFTLLFRSAVRPRLALSVCRPRFVHPFPCSPCSFSPSPFTVTQLAKCSLPLLLCHAKPDLLLPCFSCRLVIALSSISNESDSIH